MNGPKKTRRCVARALINLIAQTINTGGDEKERPVAIDQGGTAGDSKDVRNVREPPAELMGRVKEKAGPQRPGQSREWACLQILAADLRR